MRQAYVPRKFLDLDWSATSRGKSYDHKAAYAVRAAKEASSLKIVQGMDGTPPFAHHTPAKTMLRLHTCYELIHHPLLERDGNIKLVPASQLLACSASGDTELEP